jgi:hypothetical protein
MSSEDERCYDAEERDELNTKSSANSRRRLPPGQSVPSIHTQGSRPSSSQPKTTRRDTGAPESPSRNAARAEERSGVSVPSGTHSGSTKRTADGSPHKDRPAKFQKNLQQSTPEKSSLFDYFMRSPSKPKTQGWLTWDYFYASISSLTKVPLKLDVLNVVFRLRRFRLVSPLQPRISKPLTARAQLLQQGNLPLARQYRLHNLPLHF